MYIEKKDKFESEDIKIVLEAYYRFFEDMYGKRRIPFVKKNIDFSVNPDSFVDKYDANLRAAINAVTTPSNDPNFSVLYVKDDEGNLIAVARVKLETEEKLGDLIYGDPNYPDATVVRYLESHNYIHLADAIILENVTMEEGRNIYKAILEYIDTDFLEDKKGFIYLSVEIPIFDDLLVSAAITCGYERPEKNKLSDFSFRTFVLEKCSYLRNKEKGEDFARNRTYKQTEGPNK